MKSLKSILTITLLLVLCFALEPTKKVSAQEAAKASCPHPAYSAWVLVYQNYIASPDGPSACYMRESQFQRACLKCGETENDYVYFQLDHNWVYNYENNVRQCTNCFTQQTLNPVR